ncbi:MAG: PQQ-binding-like beta-propeller repeat protein [Chloroflexota bacterium]
MPASNLKSLNCPTCGAPLETDGTKPVVHCKFCQNVIFIDALRPGEKPEAAPEKARGVPEEIITQLKKGNLVEATKLYREIYDVSQMRARYAIEQILSGNLVSPEAGFSVKPDPIVQVTAAQKAGVATITGGISLIGCVLPIFIFLVVGGVIGFALLQPGGPFTDKLNAYGPAVLLPTGQDTNPDVVTQFYNVNDENRLLGRVNTITGKILWKSTPFPKGKAVDALRANNENLFYVNDNLLTALSNQDGIQVWQVEMPDNLEYGDDSLVIMNDRLLAISQDRTLQAYNTRTGDQEWSRSLNGYDRKIRKIGGWAVIMDTTVDKNTYSLIFLDPSDGHEALRITPSCQAENSLENDLGLDAGIVPDEAENSVYIIYGIFDGCVQRYNLQNGQRSWQFSQQDAYNFFNDDFHSILTESHLIFNHEHRLYTINKHSGSMQILFDDPDYELIPLYLSGDNLLVRARRTRGTERFELWGINMTMGDRVWQMILDNSKPLDPPDQYQSLLDIDEFAWTWHESPGGVLLLNFQAEPNQLVIKTISMTDGSITSEKIIPFKNISGDFYSAPSIIGWQGNLFYFSMDARLYVLDVITGEIIMQR